MEILEGLKSKLVAKEPAPGELKRASVAVIFEHADSPSVLLIKRADRAGDPWSGQIAFPGGKSQEGDGTAEGTATREAREEMGIDLQKDADFLGYFGSFRTHSGTLEVIPAIFLVRKEVEVYPNEEVSTYRWVKLEELVAERSRSTIKIESGGQTREAPALLVDGFTVWGLTHRVILSLLG